MNESMDRLRDEMAKMHDHPGVQAVGEYLCRRLEDDAEIAPAFLAEGKSLTGAFAEIKAYARKHQKGGMCYVSDSTAWEVVCRYYGIPEQAPKKAETHAPAQASGVEAGCLHSMNTAGGHANHTYAALDLDALLGGMCHGAGGSAAPCKRYSRRMSCEQQAVGPRGNGRAALPVDAGNA